MRPVYSRVCRRYPKIVEAIDQRHITYTKTQKKVFELEKEGKAFVFAPSQHIKVGTYSMNEETERELYDLGLQDYSKMKEQLQAFMERQNQK